jgi:hypothetical protein
LIDPEGVRQRCAVGGDLALQDGFAGRRQFRRLILRERALRQRNGNQHGDIRPNARCHRRSS